ncbi:hypothetical protein OS189_05415 [Sulfitobacter sp. F26169L]|uniref:MotE family protein n=1 Tax=Sulfitobacter sp. F26169L TaxID=2996015 RepID=UPI002260ED6E|nr:hypothetical protein [Sulfitobacter sp. F26169L]MCX7565773.1 hypothetical protein [Sulfitobacter sp. F26169L]
MIFSAVRKIFAPAGRGSVMVIGALLLGSATIRILSSATGVLAQDSQLPTAPMPAASEKTKSADEVNTTPQTADFTQISKRSRSEMNSLIKALSEREAQVAVREKQLGMRMRALTIADMEIEKRLKDLSETEQSLRATLSLADEASEKDLLRLTALYENMKPKDAATLFEEMDPSFAAGFLGRMRPDVAAQVMAGLSPPTAYSISVILAGRNAEVPKT